MVRKEGSSHIHRDFRVRRAVVQRALQWLITNNVYYRTNHLHIDENALAQLPQDGYLSHLNSITTESSTAANDPTTEDNAQQVIPLLRTVMH